MKKIRLSSTNIVDAMGAANMALINGQIIRRMYVPDSLGYILLLALNQATGGHSGTIAFGRALGHMGSSYSFHVGNYATTTKTKWSDSGAVFYSVKKSGIEYVAVRKDSSIVLVQLITFYGAANSAFEYASEASLTDIVQIP